MQKSRGRARATVKYKSERAGSCTVFLNIRGEENRRALRARLVKKGQGAGGCRVGKLAAGRIDRVFGDGIGGEKAEHAFLRRLPFSRILWPVFGGIFSVGDAERAGDQDR